MKLLSHSFLWPSCNDNALEKKVVAGNSLRVSHANKNEQEQRSGGKVTGWVRKKQ